MRNTLLFLRALVATNLKASVALRGAFILQSIFMMFNNLIFFSVWWLFFERFKEVRGWQLADMTALYGIVAGSFGFAVVFGGGTRSLSKMISEGDLDSFMIQPKNLLLHAVGSQSMASGWGDILTGFILVGISGYLSPSTVPLALSLFFTSTVIFIATGVLISCIAFWAGAIDNVARIMTEFVITFSVYPQTIFSGPIKWMLFTIVPAGYIGFLPVEILREFSWIKFAAILGAAVFYACFAVMVFNRGLKRYESGNRFGVRA
ncbi:MAG: ABC-2 family transporter protein [Bdellovibrionia bacterium]